MSFRISSICHDLLFEESAEPGQLNMHSVLDECEFTEIGPQSIDFSRISSVKRRDGRQVAQLSNLLDFAEVGALSQHIIL